MINEISIGEYYERGTIPLIDVRSPGEYKKGHIPGAVSIPLFTDEERAEVGTLYVKRSREEAIKLGYKFVTPKLDWYVSESKKVANSSAIAIHCWRGGMRSRSFAEHLEKNGVTDIYLIKGGYKAFRNYVLQFFEKAFTLRILGGFTGSGKTLILKKLKGLDQQVADLEGLANHKGSAFGAIGESPQPTSEQFENLLFDVMRVFNLTQPVWVEDESYSIGKVNIPAGLFRQMREQRVYYMEVPLDERAGFLADEYTVAGRQVLDESIDKIAKRLGGQNVKRAHELIGEGQYFEAARVALRYYDKAYARATSKREPGTVIRIPFEKVDPDFNAVKLLAFAENYEHDKTYAI